MAVNTVDFGPLDPGTFASGYVRFVGGVGRTGDVTLDQYYGSNNAVEFARWLYVGTTGDVSYTRWDGTNQTLVGLAAGIWHPILSIKVNTAGTTAANLVWGS